MLARAFRLALSAGAVVGSAMVEHLPPLLGYKILMLFFISSILRLCVSMGIPKLLKEVREVQPVHSVRLFFSIIGIRPLLGVDRKTIRY